MCSEVAFEKRKQVSMIYICFQGIKVWKRFLRRMGGSTDSINHMRIRNLSKFFAFTLYPLTHNQSIYSVLKPFLLDQYRIHTVRNHIISRFKVMHRVINRFKAQAK